MADLVKEIEFLCANSNFPDFRKNLSKHIRLVESLKSNPCLLPYRQDFSDRNSKQFSLSVLILCDDRKAEKMIADEAKKVGLPIDLEQYRNLDFVRRVKDRSLEFLVK